MTLDITLTLGMVLLLVAQVQLYTGVSVLVSELTDQY